MSATAKGCVRTVYKLPDKYPAVIDMSLVSVSVVFVRFASKYGTGTSIFTVRFDLVLVDMDDGPHDCSAGTNTDDPGRISIRLVLLSRYE